MELCKILGANLILSLGEDLRQLIRCVSFDETSRLSEALHQLSGFYHKSLSSHS